MTPGLLARLTPRLAFTRSRAGRGAGHNRRSARLTLACFLFGTLALNVGALVLLDEVGIRDPEYSRRVRHYKARLAENSGRPVVMVVGSSRAAMGVCPAAWEAARPQAPGRADPLLFNMSLLGSGPLMELMVARRAYADGLRPNVILFEYWPPFLYSEGGWFEPARVIQDRLLDADRDVVQRYFPNPDRVDQAMRHYRMNPVFESRERLLVQLLPNWLPSSRRTDGGWVGVDSWGWLPGMDVPPGLTERRAAAMAVCRDIYRPLFANYRISPLADRALREAVAVAREHGSAVGFVYMPEASEFRSWYTPEVERQAREHLNAISRDLAVPVIDARRWIEDGMFVDGFHLSRVGAATFTRKLGPAVVAAFPEGHP